MTSVVTGITGVILVGLWCCSSQEPELALCLGDPMLLEEDIRWWPCPPPDGTR